jgi:hypothetical protein
MACCTLPASAPLRAADPPAVSPGTVSFAIPAAADLPTPTPAEVAEVMRALLLPSSGDDAACVFSLITQLRGMLRAGSGPELSASPETLSASASFLTREMGNLRSAISRHATIASTELAGACGVALVQLPAADPMVAMLLVRSCSDKRFIRSEAEAALRVLAQVSPSSCALLMAFLRHSPTKSRQMCTTSAEMVNL